MKQEISKSTKEEYMFSLISEQINSGRSVKSFCDQHNIQSGNWFYWQKKYQRHKAASNGNDSSFTLLQITPDLITPHDNVANPYLFNQALKSVMRSLLTITSSSDLGETCNLRRLPK
ncbi:IS66 family insertion sequence element accessory protein TnpA [Chitinophaga sancti]|uniref:Transposase n=2 Tax=Chitinophaga sancti TaxID=1004 RepID=A0A1K1RSM5_9BACT|nr:hypothetical protein SAMN05661012_04188 [Chitinophaga sancti]